MTQHVSIEEIRQLEENARRLRSEAIFETFASLFKGIGSRISAVVVSAGKTNGQVLDDTRRARAQ